MAQVPRHMQMGRGQVQPSGALANALLQAGTSLDASNIFLEAPSYGSGGHYATSAAAADVNGDGKPDLLVASECVSSTNCNNGVVGILLGNGDGTFQAAQTYDSGGLYAFSIAVANVNGDGKPDLLVANQCADVSCGTGSAGVLLGNGDGTFQAPQSYNSGGQGAISIAVADVNGDSKPDLVMANQCVNSINCNNSVLGVLLGNGDGSFQAAQSYNSGGLYGFSTAVADVNGDGKPDLLVATECVSISSCTNGGVGVLLGNGNGTFQPVQTYNSGGQQTRSIAVADVNGDGKPDLLVVNECSSCTNGGVGILLGNGNGTFQPAQNYNSGGQQASSIAVADVNGDGRPDLLVANQCGDLNCNGSAGILLGNGDGSFQAVLNFASDGLNPFSLVVADVNGDGNPDLLVTNECGDASCGSGSVAVLLGKGDGTLKAAPIYNSGGQYAFSIATADVNRDGKTDLLVVNDCADVSCGSGSAAVLLGNGDGTFQAPWTYNSGGQNAFSMAVGDINGDGKPDLVVANECGSSGNCNSGGSVGFLLGNGNGTFQTAKAYGSGGQAASAIGVADVNGDGKLDVLVVNECVSSANCTNGGVGVLLGNGDGTVQTVQTYNSGGNGSLSIAVSDVNGDGKPDVLVTDQCITSGACQNGGGVGVLLGNGDGTFQLAKTFNSGGLYTSCIAVGDLNSDGKPDVVVSGSGVVGMLLGNGDGTFQAAQVTAVPGTFSEMSQIALADFDGDGKLDAAIGNGSALLLGNGDGTFQNPLYLGAGGHGAAVGDFNHDGAPDLAVGGITILLNITPRPTATTVTSVASSLNPSGYGQQVTFTASVTPIGGGTPIGSVTFTDGGNSLGVVNLAGGTASLVSTLAAGPHSVIASYSGDSNFNPSTSSALPQNVNKATTATALTSSLNPSYLKQPVTFTATVTGQFGAAVTGSVTFKQGTTNLATVSLSNGQATYTTIYTTVSIRSITAVYSGDPNNLGSTSAVLNQTVTRVPTSTAVSSSLNPSFIGDSVTFTATVTASKTSLGLPAPIGNVTFRNGGALLGTSPLNGSTATFTTSSLPAGSLSITAAYNGDANYIASTSPKLAQTVKRLPTTTSLSVNINPSAYGQTIQFTAAVAPSSGNGMPTGSVAFKSGTATLATVPLNNGVATYNNSNLAVGTKSITAVYNGGSTYASSTSSALSQVINKVATTTALTSSANPSSFGQSVTFTAAVSPQYSGTPTGSVTFKLGATILQTVTLSSGSASYTTATLPRGSDNISATYNASASFITSSGSLTQQVN